MEMSLKQQTKLKILVVDDNKLMREVVGAMIIAAGHSPIKVAGYEDALLNLQSHSIDLILLDVEMPEVNGFELTRMIREQIKEWIPIIFLSGQTSEHFLVKGIDAGGDDYLTKPVNEAILNAKIRAMARIAQMKQELHKLNEKLTKLSSIDPLTKLINRREFTAVMEREWAGHSRSGLALSVLMIDVDCFKPYNDNYGHLAGDQCLCNVAALLSSLMTRTTDIVARYGGEEFIVILPQTPIEGANKKALEIVEEFAQQAFEHGYSTVTNHVTVSIGVATNDGSAVHYEQLIDHADKALYRAKESGRNRFISYPFK